MLKRVFALLIISVLIFEQSGFAQTIPSYPVPRYLSELQNPDAFRPLHIRAVSYNPSTGKIDLSLDPGDAKGTADYGVQDKSKELFEHFRTGLVLPDSMFWVNLRPDTDRDIIDPYLERTDIGRILLAADVQLKKDVARFTSPDTKEGRAYWDKLYSKAEELFGGEDVEIPTVTRPWIVPGEIIIKQTPNGAYIYKAVMKVCLEQDWIVGHRNLVGYQKEQPARLSILNEYSSQLIRELVIPKLTREVNSSKRYSELRQVFYSLILAQWAKKRLAVSGERLGLSAAVSGERLGDRADSVERLAVSRETADRVKRLADSKDLTGLTSRKSWSKQEYYRAYRASFEQGEYNREESVRTGAGIAIRRYFSGGVVIANPGSIDVFPAGKIPDTGLHTSFDMAGKEFDGGVTAVNAVPFPFPYASEKGPRGWNDAEWLEAYVAGRAIISLADKNTAGISVGDLLDAVQSDSRDYGLKMDRQKALASLEGLRLRGLISSGNNGVSLAEDHIIRLNYDPKFIAVWSDHYEFIRHDLERALGEGADAVIDTIAAYSDISAQWSIFPVESMYPVLRASALLDKSAQEKLADILSKNRGRIKTPLADAILLELAYDKEKFNWFEHLAPELQGRSLYMVAAEVSLLAGGLGRVMQYHGSAIRDLGTKVTYIEPYYPKKKVQDKDGRNVVVDIEYAERPVSLKNIRMLPHQFDTIVNGQKVPFHVYTAVNDNGMRTFLIKDDWGFYVNILYEYGTKDSPATNFEFTEFFTKAAAETIRYLELQKRSQMLKHGKTYKAPLIDANDGQTLPLLAWIRMFYHHLGPATPNNNFKATEEIFSNAILSGTTHTYRNRGDIRNFNFGKEFLRKAGVSDEWLWLFLRKSNDSKDTFWDLTSGGLRSADIAKGVSAIHADEMSYIDPGITLFGVTNGDNRPFSSEFFRNALDEAGCKDYEHATAKEVADAKRFAKRDMAVKRVDGELMNLGLDPGQMVVSYSGRLVPEKAGRDRAFTNSNIEELVKAGIQVVIFGNAQPYESSLTIAGQLSSLQQRLDEARAREPDRYPGRFIFRQKFDIDDQRRLLAASDIQIQDSDRFTGAAEYTEADISANGGLQMGAPFWEGIIQHQGGVINRRTETGNTLIPASVKPKAYYDALIWANKQFQNNRIGIYQAQSIRFSRVLEARLTGAAYLTLWNAAASGKIIEGVKPRIAGEVYDIHDVIVSFRDEAQGMPKVEKIDDNTFCLKDPEWSSRGKRVVSVTVGLEVFNAINPWSGEKGMITAGNIKVRVVNEYGLSFPMMLESTFDGHATFTADIPDNFPFPMSGSIIVTSGLWQNSIPLKIYAQDTVAQGASLDGGKVTTGAAETEKSKDDVNRVGGVDFRAMPVVFHMIPAGALDGAPVELQVLDSQWRDIAVSLSKGDMPYGKLKDYAQACRRTPAARAQLRELSEYIENILKMEENAALPTSPALKEIIVFMD